MSEDIFKSKSSKHENIHVGRTKLNNKICIGATYNNSHINVPLERSEVIELIDCLENEIYGDDRGKTITKEYGANNIGNYINKTLIALSLLCGLLIGFILNN
jgi:hypothetical protein